MNRRLALTAILLVLLPSSPLVAQIRGYVPVVRPVFHEKTVALLNALSESMRRDGYQDASDAVKAFVKSGYGSGFVYVGEDGTDYVITSRRVVSQAESVTLEFEKDDGVTTVYKGCPVLMIDEALDLALVGFPPGARPFATGFPLSVTGADDGLEVWSAGFPEIGDRPSWQLGKGNVTDGRARVPELADPAVTTLIQHSAQVDPGNSGGPLVVSDAPSTVGYRVVGVNTWKISGRQAANFAIPTPAILGFMKSALQPSTRARDALAAALESRCRELIGALAATGDDRYRTVARFVSYDLASREGEAALKEVLSTAPSKGRSDIVDEFLGGSPFEGLRMAVAYTIQQELYARGAKALTFVAIDGDAADTISPVPVRLSDGKNLPTYWMREHGTWRLAARPLAPRPKVANAGTVAMSVAAPYRILFKAQAWAPLASGSLVFGGGVEAPVFSDYFAVGINAGATSENVVDPSTLLSTAETIIYSQLFAMVQVPLRFTRFALIPYAVAGMGSRVGTGPSLIFSTTFLYGAGVQAGFGNSPRYYAGLEIEGESDQYDTSAGIEILVSLYLGVGF